MKGTDVLTAGDVAKICGVAPKTATRWLDEGTLPGCYRLPPTSDQARRGESGDRRVRRADVLRFLRERKIPAPAWLCEGRRLLVATCQPLAWLFDDDDDHPRVLPVGWQAVRVPSLFAAGCAWAEARHEAVLFDLALSPSDCAEAARLLARQSERPLLLCLPTDDAPQEALAAFDAAVMPGCDLGRLLLERGRGTGG